MYKTSVILYMSTYNWIYRLPACQIMLALDEKHEINLKWPKQTSSYKYAV